VSKHWEGRSGEAGTKFPAAAHSNRDAATMHRTINKEAVLMTDMARRPGSQGEHELQAAHQTTARADAFYRQQMLDHLNPAMQDFIARMEMMFIATADGQGHPDSSVRVGLAGFVRVLDRDTLVYPEYRGNGVMASQGNITENPHVGLLFIDFTGSTVGLHVNGRARLVTNEDLLARPKLPEAVRDDIAVTGGRHPERWVEVSVDEAYIHCSKHLPLMTKQDKALAWGTDDARAKGGDYFGVSASRRPLP